MSRERSRGREGGREREGRRKGEREGEREGGGERRRGGGMKGGKERKRRRKIKHENITHSHTPPQPLCQNIVIATQQPPSVLTILKLTLVLNLYET